MTNFTIKRAWFVTGLVHYSGASAVLRTSRDGRCLDARVRPRKVGGRWGGARGRGGAGRGGRRRRWCLMPCDIGIDTCTKNQTSTLPTTVFTVSRKGSASLLHDCVLGVGIGRRHRVGGLERGERVDAKLDHHDSWHVDVSDWLSCGML